MSKNPIKLFKKILQFIKDKEDFIFIKHPIVYFTHTVLNIVIGGFLILFITFGILLFFNTDKFLYHPTNEDFYDCWQFSDYQKIAHNQTRFYYQNQNSNQTIIYYHGNRGTACDRYYLKNFYEKFNSNLIFVEYSGFANDNKKPSKELLFQDTKNIQNFIQTKTNTTKIILIGESLGTALASYHTQHTNHLKNQNITTNLILIAPFDSVENVAKNSYLKYYPHAIYNYDNYNNIQYLQNYNQKLTIIHGTQDINIPIIRAENLYNKTNTKNKNFFEIVKANHNNIYNFYQTSDAIEFGIK